MEEEIENLHKKIEELEKKVDLFYQLLLVKNELDFVLKGYYVLDEEIEDVLNGDY